jgi:hypothetical protein
LKTSSSKSIHGVKDSGTPDGRLHFWPERGVQNESLLHKLLARAFTSEDIDSVKRNLGQVRDLTHSATAYQKELLALHEQGFGVCEIARRLGLHRKSVARAIQRAKRRV